MAARMTSSDALQILELTPGASPAQIRRAYRRLALIWHPDRHATDPQRRKQAEERFKVISAAYQHLKEFGPYDGGSPDPPPPPPPPPRARRPPSAQQGRSTRSGATRPTHRLPEAPWWVRPVSFRAVLVMYLVLRVAACFHEPTYRLTDPPPIPEISHPTTHGER